ncbi:MAG: hypothetical protein ACLQT6_11915 [Desulfomonilaceae bacterium]
MAYALGVLLMALAFSWSASAAAYEFSGKLERLDSNTVTLLGKDSDKKTGRICQEQRERAARFLGKSVTVNFEKQRGEEWATSFEALK